jgi:hypothetical protein
VSAEREYEIKFSMPLKGGDTKCVIDRECDVPATVEITVGRVENRYGTDYQACPFHEDATLAHHIEQTEENWLDRVERRAAERYNTREGK